MNQFQTAERQTDESGGTNKLPMIDLLIILAKHKKKIIAMPICAMAASLAITFVMPDVYRATTKLLPPQQSASSAAALLSQLGGVASAVVGGSALKNPADLYVGMLQSRTIADDLIAKYKLQQIYNVGTMEKARKQLENASTIVVGKDGIISIDVEAEDKVLATRIANSYVDELFAMTKRLALTEAAQRRVFFERQLENAKNNLASAEQALKKGIDTRGVISVDADSRAVMETMGRLRAQVSAKEIQLNSMRAFVTPNNSEFKRVQEELTSLRAEVSRLENGNGGDNATQGDKQVGLESIKILRDVKYYQMLYELLAKQYEVARLDEAKDPAIIQVLDPAVEPENKFKPKRGMIVAITGVLSLILAVIVVFLIEAKRALRQSPRFAAQLAELDHHLKRTKA
jgi:uncharacterized protein involved in exopolysaccharide biosynthesis